MSMPALASRLTAVDMLGRLAAQHGYSPAAMSRQPIAALVDACRAEPKGGKATESGVRNVLAAYRRRHGFPATEQNQ